MLLYFMGIRFILKPFGKFYGHLVHFVVIWYIFPRFGMLHQGKASTPVENGTNFVRRLFLYKLL
jgi:hypothetical protein